VNGAYGERIATIAARAGRRVVRVDHDETSPVDPARIAAALADDPGLSHVAVVYCETTTGVRNPVDAVADVVAAHGRRLLVDAMSAFGALPLTGRDPIDAVAASSNKCLEGVPGLGLVIARSAAIAATAGHCASVSLDLYDQWRRLEFDGQFRFTPPTHVIAALDATLDQHAAEGGVAGRGARYQRNCDTLVAGLRDLGFALLLPDAVQAPIIVTVRQPSDPAWHFQRFYDALVARGFAIYPGKLTTAETFRVGCIGQVFPADLERFLAAVREILAEQGVTEVR
jgi:2-aminoethylphosphonate-pyruvate transaminase